MKALPLSRKLTEGKSKMIKLSKTSKLDGILSWSLQAIDTCPGSSDGNGGLVPACQGCYATTGNYRFANVKKPREFNREDWKRDTWVMDMIQALENSRYFRWFDSGDMYDTKLAEKILMVMTQTQHVKHWLPTRMHKFSKFKNVIDSMQSLPNVVVRFSSDSVNGEIIPGQTTSTIFSDTVPAGAVECQAYQHEGKCNGCRACYDKTVPVIAYKAHGVKMAKVIKIQSIK
jgi:hypothetical protein